MFLYDTQILSYINIIEFIQSYDDMIFYQKNYEVV